MLKVLGVKIVAFLAFLVISNAGIVAAWYYLLTPYEEDIGRQLQATKSEVESKRLEVAKMKEEFVLLQAQLKTFKQIEHDGFFNDQDRYYAGEKMDKLSGYAGLLNASVKFGQGEQVDDPLVSNSGSIILNSPVTVEIKSIDDVDIYSFIKFLQEKFPGKVAVKSFKLERKETLNAAMYRKIGGGDPTELVHSDLSFDWLTMPSKDKLQPAQTGTQ
ncbi:MAG: hypothetical protein WC043_03195 [Pseudobdellovibrionaceae bacterium]